MEERKYCNGYCKEYWRKEEERGKKKKGVGGLLYFAVLYSTSPVSAIEYPKTCIGVTCTPKMSTELVIRRMSCVEGGGRGVSVLTFHEG